MSIQDKIYDSASGAIACRGSGLACAKDMNVRAALALGMLKWRCEPKSDKKSVHESSFCEHFDRSKGELELAWY